MRMIGWCSGLTALVLSAGLAVSQASAGEGCHGAKSGSKSKMGAACSSYEGKALKDCGFTDKRMSKTDQEMYVCPALDHCSEKAGKCPSCGKKLEKKYCPMKEVRQKMGTGAKEI